MIGKKMEDALNGQLNAELYSAYLYLSMSAYFEDRTLEGFANWMRVQVQEEQTHAMKLFDHIVTRQDADVELLPIDKPDKKPTSLREAFEMSRDREVGASFAKNHEEPDGKKARGNQLSF